MPLYEYVCQDCRDEFELLIRSSDEPSCPACGSSKLEKLLSVPVAHSGGGRLPICEGPVRQAPCGMGGCGLPECGDG